MKGQWEDRFERRHGFWRGFVDEQVRRYLDCGLFENGFARVQCPDCYAEYLLAFSCKTRELCPSCAARRAAATAVLLADDVLEEVGHAQWVFVMPKMLRPYFLHHRELLGGLARAAWETVLQLMVAATNEDALRPGMTYDLSPSFFDPIMSRLGDLIYRHVPIQPFVMSPVNLTHPALADLFDDAVMAEGAIDEVLHCLGSSGAMVSQLRGA